MSPRMALVSTNPATGETLGVHAEHDPARVELLLARAHAAARRWALTPPEERGAALVRLAAVLRAEAPALAREAALEMGKPLAQGAAEVERCASVCTYFAELAPRELASRAVATPWPASRVEHRPLGVVLAVMPWNYPYWQVVRAAAAALAAGNTVLLKHARNVYGCATRLTAAFHTAGLGEGIFDLLRLDNAAVGAVIEDPRVRAVTFTGSTRAGRRIAAHAAAGPKPCVFELGGSDAYIVLDDADLDLAAEVCAAARLVNTGQSCIAAKRIVVAAAVRTAFEERFVARMRARTLGDPLAAGTDLGPLARRDLRDAVADQVARSVASGARLLAGGAVPDGPGAFHPATVLTDVTPGMAAFDEEVFGPAAAVTVAGDDADAVRLANLSPYGLGAAVFSRDPARAERAVAALETGLAAINAQVRSDIRLPFGGVKASGYGRELGTFGLHAFVAPRSVVTGPA